MRHIQFSPHDTIIDIRKDRVFKAAFTADSPLSQGALRALISAFVGRKVEALTLIANEPAPSDIRDRQFRYDIRVKFDGGELANVEVTLRPGDFETLRFEYYLARLHTSQDIRGRTGYHTLMPSWQINFVSGRKLFKDEWYIHHFEYYDGERGVSLGGRTHIIAVELEKVERILNTPVEGMSAVERWAAFFRYAGDEGKRDLVNGLMKAEEGIAMAGEMLLTVSQDEIELAQRETELKIELDWESYMNEARQEGLSKGLAEGQAKGRQEGLVEGQAKGRQEGLVEGQAKARQEKLESARRLKAMGIPPDKIAVGLGLSPEDIEAR
ncbi:MAG: Rpn family recombination-promoting nuclease/putative transposase [Treponema sp.]|jgi:predicted transposase/invertase (TIGR01784 family)|nr:Rpn family recombination-promoting nuclease/putative transposase [Treponema sp.]